MKYVNVKQYLMKTALYKNTAKTVIDSQNTLIWKATVILINGQAKSYEIGELFK